MGASCLTERTSVPSHWSPMPATPRVMFTSFQTSAEPLLRAWVRFRDEIVNANRLVTDPQPGGSGDRSPGRAVAVPHQSVAALPGASGSFPGAGSAGVWRLLATNNRELARSSHAYTSLDGAQAHIARIRDRVDALGVVFVLGPSPGMRGWFLTLDGHVVATCGRWYGGVVPCQESSAATIDSLRTATIAESARPGGPPAARPGALSLQSQHVLAW